jgi:hypothetical protein
MHDAMPWLAFVVMPGLAMALLIAVMAIEGRKGR